MKRIWLVVDIGWINLKNTIPLTHQNISAHFFNENMNFTNEQQDYLFKNKTT